MNISFLSLKELNKKFEIEFGKEFNTFIESGWYILGDKLKKFEEEYASFHSVNNCIGVANGLDALILSLKALEIGVGDEVIVPTNTYIASWLAISYVGAKPIPVEPKIDTYNINPDLIEEKITSKTRAIMPVHLYGQACEMEKILNISKKYNLLIIEDNAQAQGAFYNDKMTGTFGICNATSFYPGKNLGALGDGGAITTNDNVISNKIKTLRNYGSNIKYYNEIKGINSRLDELQASFLSIKLKHLKKDNEKRQCLANLYYDGLSEIDDINLPKISLNSTHTYHLFVIRTRKRNQLQEFLKSKGIGTMIHYPIPPHLQVAYSDLGYKKGSFPIAEEISETCLSLPLSPYLSELEVNSIINCIKLFYK